MGWAAQLARAGAAALLGLLAHTACSGSSFVCEQDGECGEGGTCQSPGYCSFPDATCESGQRYGELAGDFGGQCVPVDGETESTSTSTTTGMATTEGPTTSSAAGSESSATSSTTTSSTSPLTTSSTTATTSTTTTSTTTTTTTSSETGTTSEDSTSSTGAEGSTTDSTPPRVSAGLVVLYDFADFGAEIPDVSGVVPLMPLAVEGSGFIPTATGLRKTEADSILRHVAGAQSSKLHVACQATNEITVEAWVSSELAEEVPSRVVTYSVNGTSRNFTLGLRDGVGVTWRLRVDDAYNGLPEVVAATPFAPGPTHIVVTHGSDGSEVVYVDGVVVQTLARPGSFAMWDPEGGHAFALGDELHLQRPWYGEYHLVAAYDRALLASEVGQNFDAGF